MNQFIKLFLVGISIVLGCNIGSSQENKLKIGGSLALGSFHYYDTHQNTGLQPFGLSLAANARISYGQFHIPIGISINNQGTTVQNPFNRYGISPTYKWAKVHLGWRRMQFSKFTMNGVQFFGAGIELTPGLLRASAMHGKLDYRIPGLPIEYNDLLPDRKITAFKLGVGNQFNYFDLVFMKAQDEMNMQDTLTKPKENAALGADMKASFFKNKVVLSLDGGISVFTENRNLGDSWLKEVDVPSLANKMVTPNNSTHINYALEAGIDFYLGAFSIKNQYRRVMPEYQSLGLNYLRNDIESLLFSPSLKLWKNKVLLSGSVGLEKNNLDDLRNMDQSRVISSVNLNLRPNPSHSINLLYSNYSFDQTIKFDSLITNSIVIQQVNRNIGGSYVYSQFDEVKTHMISVTVNVQDAINPAEESLNNSTLAAMVNYSTSRIKSKSTFNIGINYFDIALIENSVRQGGINGGYTYRSGGNTMSVQGGSMVSFGDQLFNSHLSFRYKKELAKRVNLELSSRLRNNQRVNTEDRFIVRSDLKLVIKL